MSDTSKSTTDHDAIRRWAEERGGRPATVKDTEGAGDEAGVLRIDFQEPDADLEEISWDEWFAKFDEKRLCFVHQDETAGGDTSRFFKLTAR